MSLEDRAGVAASARHRKRQRSNRLCSSERVSPDMIRFEFGKLGKRRVLTTSGNGELVIRPLGPKEPYVAISHIWGGNTNTIKGIKWKVATWMSLERCKALVKSYDCVWIDSLCIDQVHGEDKHAQIKNMHKIYEDAEYVAVVLTGDYGRQLTSLRRLTELLIDLKSLGRECTSSRHCTYLKTMEGIEEAAVVVNEMQWFKRVWTLQEAIVPAFLTFVGFDQDGKLKRDVTTMDEIREFIHAFDLVCDVGTEYWAGSLTHPCTLSVIDCLGVCQKVRDIVNLMTPINLNWYKDTKRLKERRRCLEYTAYRVFKQLHKRDCKFIHDRVYGVCALLGIKISRVDYKREYEDVFIEAVKKLVERGVCALPLRPQLVHGNTWLPSLKDVDLKDAWKLVKSTCAMNEEEDSYHNLVCEGDRVYATGGLVQMVNPFKLRTSMETIGKILQDFVEAVHVEKDFDPVGSIQDPALLTITCVVLWMFRNRGNDAEVTTRDVDTVILSVYNNKKSADEVESSKDKNRCNILEEFGIAASDIKWHLDTQKLTTSQVVANILEACALVPLEDNSAHKIASLVDRDAILVVKKKLGFVLCSVPSSVQSSYDTYGFFYKSSLGVRVREISCNVLVLNGDDVWDNYGDALCWYIGRVRNICKRRICVGTIH